MNLHPAAFRDFRTSPKRERGTWYSLAYASGLYVFGASLLIVTAQEPPPIRDDEALTEPRRLVQDIVIEQAQPDGRWRKVDLVGQPVLRFADPTRDHGNGTIWIWGARGRPSTILELFQDTRRDAGGWWLGFNNISGGQQRGRLRGMDWWRSNQSEVIVKRMPDAAAPAKDPRLRLSQIKELARRFSAHEFWDPNNSRFELRLLPQPLHRYEEADKGLLDGGLFVFANGTNPELILLIEARRSGTSAAEWEYGLARSSHAEVHVLLDDAEVWTVPRVNQVKPDQPYTMFFDAATGN